MIDLSVHAVKHIRNEKRRDDGLEIQRGDRERVTMKDNRMPSGRAPRCAVADQTARATEADLNEERLWRLLEQGTVTMRELREQGVKAPAQGLYALQIAGYVIDRVHVQDGAGHVLAYRLNTTSEAFSDQCAAPEVPRDRPLTALHPAVGAEIR